MASDSYKAAWKNIWKEVDGNGPAQKVAQQYPQKRDIPISGSTFTEAGIDDITNNPDEVFAAGRATFPNFVQQTDWDDVYEGDFPALSINIHNIGKSIRPEEPLSEHFNKIIQGTNELKSIEQRETRILSSAHVCPEGHVIEIHQPVTQQERRSINTCPKEGCEKGVYFDPHRSCWGQLVVFTLDSTGSDDGVKAVGDGWAIERINDAKPGQVVSYSAIPRPIMSKGGVTMEGSILEITNLKIRK